MIYVSIERGLYQNENIKFRIKIKPRKEINEFDPALFLIDVLNYDGIDINTITTKYGFSPYFMKGDRARMRVPAEYRYRILDENNSRFNCDPTDAPWELKIQRFNEFLDDVRELIDAYKTIKCGNDILAECVKEKYYYNVKESIADLNATTKTDRYNADKILLFLKWKWIECHKNAILKQEWEEVKRKENHLLYSLVEFCEKIEDPIDKHIFEKYIATEYTDLSIENLTYVEMLRCIELRERYKKECTVYTIPSLEVFILFCIVNCFEKGCKIEKCVECGKYFVPYKNQNTCSDICKKKRIQTNAFNRNQIKVVQLAGKVKKRYVNLLDREDVFFNINREHGDKLKEALFAVLDYYRLVIFKANKILKGDMYDDVDRDNFYNRYYAWLSKIYDISPGEIQMDLKKNRIKKVIFDFNNMEKEFKIEVINIV